MNSEHLRPSERFRVATFHGESGSRFHVVDSAAPESDQPAILASFRERERADRMADSRNASPALKRFRCARAQRRRSAWAQHGHALARAFQHLAGCDGLTLGRAFVLSLGRERYVAVRYSQSVPIAQGCPAWDRGERVHVREALFLLGAPPRSYLSRHAKRYTFEVHDDASAAGALGGTWYVAGYSTSASEGIAVQRGATYSGPNVLLFREEGTPTGAGAMLPQGRTLRGRGDTL